MYQDQSMVNSRAGQVATKESTMADGAVSRLMNVNDEREKLLYSISEKLHEVYNQRGPIAPGQTEPPTPMESDFFTRMHRQIARADEDNNKIRNILNHLNQIA